MMRFHFAVLHFSIALGLALTAQAKDQFVVLSGGGNPAINNFSLYLQSKTLADHLTLHFGADRVSVFFAAGNQLGQPPLLADVRKIVSTPEGQRDVLFPGALRENRPATKPTVVNFLRDLKSSPIAPHDRGGASNLFLLVSDHGMPNRDDSGEIDVTYSNNCINLWGYEANLVQQKFRSLDFEDSCLSRDELQRSMANFLRTGSGRMLYAMSQCYSGGFHQLSVKHSGPYPSANPRICGFTSTTENEIASGCTADVDGPNYQGYERYFTEHLTGTDVVSGQFLRSPRRSLKEAHQWAALQDMTVDLPLATSDYFLLKWHEKISQQSFAPRTPIITAITARRLAFERSLPGAVHLQGDLDYADKDRFFDKMLDVVSREYPDYKSAIRGNLGSLMQLDKNLASQIKDLRSILFDTMSDQKAKLGQIYTAWSVLAGSPRSTLSPYDSRLETDLFYLHDLESGFGMGDRNALFTMAIKAIVDPEGHSAISSYKAQRQSLAIQWALTKGDQNLRWLAERAQALNIEVDRRETELLAMSKRRNLIRRVLMYRQILGAWNALVAMQDRTALNELKALVTCENTQMR